MKKLLIILTLLGFIFGSYAKADTDEEQAKQNSNTTQDIFTDDGFYEEEEEMPSRELSYAAKELGNMTKIALESVQNQLGFLDNTIYLNYDEVIVSPDSQQSYSILRSYSSNKDKNITGNCLSIFKNSNELLNTSCYDNYNTRIKDNFFASKRELIQDKKIIAYVVLEMLDDKVVLYQYSIKQKDNDNKTIKFLDLYKADKKNQLVLTKDNFTQTLTKIEKNVSDETIRQALLDNRITKPQKINTPFYTPAQFADMATHSLENFQDKYYFSDAQTGLYFNEVKINSKIYPIIQVSSIRVDDLGRTSYINCLNVFGDKTTKHLDFAACSQGANLVQKDNYFTLELTSASRTEDEKLTRYITFKVLPDKVILYRYGVEIYISREEDNLPDKEATLILYKADKNNEIILGKDNMQEKLKEFESKVKDRYYARVLDWYLI